MLLKPVVSLRVNGVGLTPHQLDVLLAVHQEGSQRRAGQKLRIATPVIHRYLAQMEVKVGVKLLKTSGTGGASIKDMPGGRFMVVAQRGPREVHQKGDGAICQVGTVFGTPSAWNASTATASEPRRPLASACAP